MGISASDVAKYLIRHFCAQKQPISNLKLQKLLYYCQGWHLGITGRPLFSDPIEAWVHGPVVPSVFREYRQYQWSPIAKSGEVPRFSAHTTKLIESVIAAYGSFSAAQLEQLSHQETPWLGTRGDLPPNCSSSREISHKHMAAFFGNLANG